MISRTTAATALAVMLLAVCVSAQSLTTTSMSYQVANQLGVVTVPATDASLIKSHSIAAWIRPSMTMDFIYPFATFSAKHSLVVGASTSKSGWGDNVRGTDSFISTYVSRWQDGSGLILGYDDADTFAYLRVEVDFDKFFGRWYYIYGAYHQDLNVMYFAVYNSYSSAWTEAWSKNTIVKHAIKDFYQYSVGSTDVKKSTQLNGYIYGDQFTYKSDATYFKKYADIDAYIKRAAFPAPKYIGVTTKTVFTVLKEKTVVEPFQQTLAAYQGADEYSVTGTFKFTVKPTSVSTFLLFRVSTLILSTSAKAYVVGDRTLHGQVEAGKICFYSYKLSLDKVADIKICFTTAPIAADTLYYFYQGYSRTQKRLFSYLRVNNIDYTQIITDTVHADPNAFYVYVGADQVAKQSSTVFTLNTEFGPGAYRETLITTIPSFDSPDVPPKVEIPSTYVTPALVSSNPTVTTSLDARSVDPKYISALDGFSIAFWYRRDLNLPVFSNLIQSRMEQSIAGVTQNTVYNYGSNFFAVRYQSHSAGDQPAYIIQTNLNGNVNTAVVSFNTTQDQGEWHWIYLGYNVTKNQLSYSVDFGNNTVITKTIDNLVSPSITTLKAILGSDGTATVPPVPGEFYDFQFVYHNSSYVNNAADVATYITAHRSSPPARVAPSAAYEFNPSESVVVEISKEQIAYADSYSVAGWAKWDKNTTFSPNGNVLFQLTINNPVTDSNPKRLGDHALEIVVNQNEVTFNTYNLGYVNTLDKEVVSQSVDIDYLVGQWCLYYFGYDRTNQTARGFVKCDSGFSGSVVFTGLGHIIPTQATLYIGKSYNYDSFVGLLFTPTLLVNKGLELGGKAPQSFEDNRPAKSTCAILFSDCGFQTEFLTVCENIPQLDLSQIKSLLIPNGYVLRFYRQTYYNGLNVKFIDTVQCMENSLINQPDLTWEKLAALFQQGKIAFTNDNGQDISLDEAHTMFFKNSVTQKTRSSLRKTHKGHQQHALLE